MESRLVILTGLSALVFITVHLESFRLQKVPKTYHRRLLSLAGGIESSFVFLNLMPRIQLTAPSGLDGAGGETVRDLLVETSLFGVAYLGFLLFFLLQSVAIRSRTREVQTLEQSVSQRPGQFALFIIHISVVAVLTSIVTLLLRFEAAIGAVRLLSYTTALSLHFMVTGRSLKENYPYLFERFGRFVLAAAVVVGWFISFFTAREVVAINILFAFVAGAMLFNVIKEEIPRAGKANTRYFFLGAGLFTLLKILSVWSR